MKVTLLASYLDESMAVMGSGVCVGTEGTEIGFSKAIESGHMSILEHLPATFLIKNISRSCSHQLVRYRANKPSQASQRYIKYDGDKYHYLDLHNKVQDIIVRGLSFNNKDLIYELNKFCITPPSIRYNKNSLCFLRFASNMFYGMYNYLELLEQKVPAEDSRFVLPNAFKTDLIVTIDMRNFIHQCNERLCLLAQWEISHLYFLMKECIKEIYPTVYSYCKPKCKTCTETRPCKRKGNKK